MDRSPSSCLHHRSSPAYVTVTAARVKAHTECVMISHVVSFLTNGGLTEIHVEAIGLSFEHSGLSMVCSLGALKLCELCPVKGTRLASYYAIGTDSVLGAVGRALPCIDDIRGPQARVCRAPPQQRWPLSASTSVLAWYCLSRAHRAPPKPCITAIFRGG